MQRYIALATCSLLFVAPSANAGPRDSHFSDVDQPTPQHQVLPDVPPAEYAPQEISFIDSIKTVSLWKQLKGKLDTNDYKEYIFSVNAATPPHRHDEVRQKVANIEFPKGWVLLFLKADGQWTFDKNHKDVGKCGAEGFPNRGAQGGALCETGNAKFGQLILCQVDKKGSVPGIIGVIFVPFRGIGKPVYNPLWNLELLPLMNDPKKKAKYYQEDNEGFIDCHVIVVNPKAKLRP